MFPLCLPAKETESTGTAFKRLEISPVLLHLALGGASPHLLGSGKAEQQVQLARCRREQLVQLFVRLHPGKRNSTSPLSANACSIPSIHNLAPARSDNGQVKATAACRAGGGSVEIAGGTALTASGSTVSAGSFVSSRGRTLGETLERQQPVIIGRLMLGRNSKPKVIGIEIGSHVGGPTVKISVVPSRLILPAPKGGNKMTERRGYSPPS